MGMFTYDKETNTLELLARILDVLGEKCTAQGLQLLYHNHDFEFKPNNDGIIPIDYLLENCNPTHVNFEIDLYWVVKAGANPTDYFNKYPGHDLKFGI